MKKTCQMFVVLKNNSWLIFLRKSCHKIWSLFFTVEHSWCITPNRGLSLFWVNLGYIVVIVVEIMIMYPWINVWNHIMYDHKFCKRMATGWIGATVNIELLKVNSSVDNVRFSPNTKGIHPKSGGARREITCWHLAEDSDAWCQQVISRLAPPDERVLSFYTVLLLLLWRRRSEIFRSASLLRDPPCSTTWWSIT